MPSESGSGRGEPGLVGVAKPRGHCGTGRTVQWRAPRRDGCREEVAAGGGPSLRGDVFKWSKFGGAVVGQCASCAKGLAQGSRS
jgi:hypothetical protein